MKQIDSFALKQPYVCPAAECYELKKGLNLLETLSLEGNVIDFGETEYDEFQ